MSAGLSESHIFPDAPKNTSVSVSPAGRVAAGTRVNLTCSSRANPRVSRFTWFKRGGAGPVNVSEGRLYSFEATDGGVYFCVATNDLGTENSTDVNLDDEGKYGSKPHTGVKRGDWMKLGDIRRWKRIKKKNLAKALSQFLQKITSYTDNAQHCHFAGMKGQCMCQTKQIY